MALPTTEDEAGPFVAGSRHVDSLRSEGRLLMLIESYAVDAIRRWQADPRTSALRPHAPSTCECLTCADGRDALGLIPLRPLFSRRRIDSQVRT